MHRDDPRTLTTNAIRGRVPLLLYFPAAALGALLFARVFFAPTKVDGNSTEYLLAGRLILAGKIPFQDFWDVNPPHVFYLHAIPVWMAQLFGITPELALLGLVFGLIVLAVALLSATPMDRSARPFVLFGFLLGSWLAAVLNEFGEREHLFAVVLLPYLVGRSRGTAMPRFFLAWAFLTVLFGLFKPDFLLILLGAELVFYRQTARRPSGPLILALLSPLLVYFAIFLRMPFPALRAYFLEQLPLVAKYYSTLNNTWAEIFSLWRPYFYYVPLVLLLLAERFTRSRSAPSNLLAAIGTVAALSFCLVMAAHKAYGYHMLIFDTLLCTGSLLALRELWAGKSLRRWSVKVSALLVLVLLVSLYGGYIRLRGADAGFSHTNDMGAAFFAPPFKWSKPGERVVVFSSNPDVAWPMIYGHQLWPGTRYLIMYPLGFFNMNPERTRELEQVPAKLEVAGPEEASFIDNVREDLERNKPELLVFPLRYPMPARLHLNPIRYAQAAGWFKAMGTNYHLVVDDADYIVFRRNHPGEGSR